jgi:hypothetical protein
MLTRLPRCGYVRSQHPLEQARTRMQLAKSAWSTATVNVALRHVGAAERIPGALAELQAAFAAFDAAQMQAGQ